MRQPLAETRDTFDYANLPPPAALEQCELNYRTSPPRTESERASALRVALWYFVLLVVAVPALLVLAAFPLDTLAFFGIPAALYLIGTSLWNFLLARASWNGVIGGIACFAVLAYIVLVKLLPFAEAAYLAGFVPAIFMTCRFADVVGLQVATWITVNLRVEWETGARWAGYWRLIHGAGPVPSDCPEVAQSRAARPALAAALLLGGVATFVALRTTAPHWAGVSGVIVVACSIPLAWIVTHVATGTRIPPPLLTLRTTGWAILTWWSYNRHEVRAPGVFQFPTTWCRSKWKRDAALGLVLLALALALVPLTPVVARGVLEPLPWSSIDGLANSTVGRSIEQFRVARAGEIRAAIEADPPGLSYLPTLCLFASAGSPLLLLLVTWLLYGSVLTRFHAALEAEGAPGHSTKWGPWDNAVDRLLNSPAAEDNRHLFLGRNYYLDYPVLLNRRILDEHAHITGGSGGGKTSLGVAPLLSQLIASEDCSVVVLDLKGDRAMLRTAEIEARRSGATFKWFTNRREVSSYVFNPFQQSHIPRLTPNQRTQAVLQGLSLDYGEAYGKSFFTAMSESTLLQILQRTFVDSFVGLSREFRNLGPAAKDSRHLAALVARLCEIYPLNITEHQLADRPGVWDARIDAPDILRNRQVAYFYLSSPEESLSAPAIAKLLVYSLFTAAANRQPGEDKQVYLFIDEFQRVTSQSVKLVLEQGRSLGLTFIVVHQSSEQLVSGDRALLQVVDECTAFKQVFRAQDEKEVRRIMDRSGVALYHTLSWQQEYDARAARAEDWFRPSAAREGVVLIGETPGPRLDRNTVSELSAAPQASFVSFGVNRGFTQYGGYVTPVQCDYHVSEGEYIERGKAAWPEKRDCTVAVPPASILNPGWKEPRQPPAGNENDEANADSGEKPDSFQDATNKIINGQEEA